MATLNLRMLSIQYNCDTCGATTNDLLFHCRLPLHKCFRDDWLQRWLQKCHQLRSRNISHASMLVSNVLMMKRMSVTTLGHCPFSSRSCHPSLGHKSLTWIPLAMTGQQSCHLLDLSESALLAYSGIEWSHKPIHRHISCFATKVLLVGVDHFDPSHSDDS